MKRELLIAGGSSLATLLLAAALFIVISAPTTLVRSGAQLDYAKGGSGSPESTDSSQGTTLMVYTYSATVEVASVGEAEAAARSAMSGLGGYLSGSDGRYERRDSLTLTFKVPADRLDEVPAAVEGLGRVESESMDAYDVKQEYDELSARIGSYQAERERLMEFYARANETSDLIEISNRLSHVDSQLTYLTQRRAQLQDRVDYATVRLTLRERMGPLSQFVLVELWELFDRFSGGLNASMMLLFGSAGFLLPLAVLALLGLAAHRTYISWKSR